MKTKFKQEVITLVANVSNNATSFRDQSEFLTNAATELEAIARWLKNKRSKGWVNVSETKRKVGQKYIVRRVFLYPNRREMPAAVAMWTEHGWRTLFGDLYPATSNATIEVLK